MFYSKKAHMESTTKTTTLKIEGMACGGCVKKVTAALSGVGGITTKSVAVGTATIGFETMAQVRDACDAIHSAGFKASDLHHETHVAHAPNAAQAANAMTNEGANGAIGAAKAMTKALE